MKPVLAQADSCCVLLNPKKLCNTRVAKLHSCLTDPVAHFLLLKSSMNKLFDSREIIFFCTFEPRRQMVDGNVYLNLLKIPKRGTQLSSRDVMGFQTGTQNLLFVASEVITEP